MSSYQTCNILLSLVRTQLVLPLSFPHKNVIAIPKQAINPLIYRYLRNNYVSLHTEIGNIPKGSRTLKQQEIRI